MAKPDSMIAVEAFCCHHGQLSHLTLKKTGVWKKTHKNRTKKITIYHLGYLERTAEEMQKETNKECNSFVIYREHPHLLQQTALLTVS